MSYYSRVFQSFLIGFCALVVLALWGGPSLQAQTLPGNSTGNAVITNGVDIYRIQEVKDSDLPADASKDGNSARYRDCADYATALVSHDYRVERDRSGIFGDKYRGNTLYSDMTNAEEERVWRGHFNRCLALEGQ